MRAIQITDLSGPATALEARRRPGARAVAPADAGRAASWSTCTPPGVSFPEVLQTRGEYQVKPPLPFVPGQRGGGRRAQRAGRRAASSPAIAWPRSACSAASPRSPSRRAFLTFTLPDALDFAQGAGLILNYHTAYFSLKLRGRLAEGETVLVHGAAGGVGTASLQVAKGLGAKTIAVVSSDEKEQVAREAGADEVVRSDGAWKDEAKELSGGGVDVVLDPVGGDRFTDSLRSLREGGRAVVVGFTGGSIPEVRVNRLLLNNIEVVGAGWGAYVHGQARTSTGRSARRSTA